MERTYRSIYKKNAQRGYLSNMWFTIGYMYLLLEHRQLSSLLLLFLD